MSGPIARPYYYLGGNWALTQLSTSQPFFVNTQDRGVAPWIILGGSWENFVDDILCAYAQPGMTIVDVGANLGYYTIKLGGLAGPAGRVYSFEPNPELIEFVVRNIDINGFNGRCTFFPAAAGASKGTAELTFPYANMGGGYLRGPNEPKYDRSFEVPVVTIDESLAEVAKVDLIKIDAEGYEPLVLAGATALLARSPDCALLVEVHLAAWERFGRFEDQVWQIGGNRNIFAVTYATRLVPVRVSQIRTYLRDHTNGMAYFLFCPHDQKLLAPINRFIDFE